MICPKCGHKNTQNVSCTQCGVIFEKYIQAEQRQRQLEQEQWEQEDRRKKNLQMAGGGAVALVALIALFVLLPSDEDDQSPTAQTRSRPVMDYYPWEAGTTPGYWEQEGTQLKWIPTPDLPVLGELSSKLVTVDDRYRSGFLITDDCHVIYSGKPSQKGHSRDQSNKNRNQVDYDLAAQDLERAKQDFDEKRIKFVNSCKVCDDESFKRALRREISRVKKSENALIRARERLDSSEEVLERSSQLRVSLNKSSATARVVETGNRYNLTLLLLDKPHCDSLAVGYPDELQEGDAVFALTGHRKDQLMGGEYGGVSGSVGPKGYLLHDIKINKGDLGTPLFDKEGQVVGITVAPAGGSPRAIPIGQALRDLNLLL